MLLATITLLWLTACETRVVMPEQPQANTISVQGVSEFDVAPDISKIAFRVETQSMNAQEAQTANRKIANDVYAALAREGVRENEIETTTYRIEKVQEWDPKLERIVDKGYRVVNVFVVTTRQLERVGRLLDAGVQAGANGVESITFELSDAKQKEVKNEALRKAAGNAREKAEALAEGIGVRLGKVLSIQEQSYYIVPYRYDLMAKAEAMGEMPPTPISPEAVHVSAQVSVSFEIG